MTLGDRASSLSEHLCLAGVLIELGTASPWLTDCSTARFQVPISTGGEREEGLPPSVTQAVERILKKSTRWSRIEETVCKPFVQPRTNV